MNEGPGGHQLVKLTTNNRNERPGGSEISCTYMIAYLIFCMGNNFFKVQYNLVVGSKIKWNLLLVMEIFCYIWLEMLGHKDKKGKDCWSNQNKDYQLIVII